MLNEIASISGGKFLTIKDTEKENKINENDDYAYIFKFSAIDDNNRIDYNKMDKIKIENEYDFLRYKLQEDDIILYSRGSSYRIMQLPGIEKDVIFSHNYITIKCKKSVLYPPFLKMYLDILIGREVLKIKKRGRMILIKIDDIKKLEMPDLKYDDQVEIVNDIKNAQNIIEEAKNNYNNLINKINKKLV